MDDLNPYEDDLDEEMEGDLPPEEDDFNEKEEESY